MSGRPFALSFACIAAFSVHCSLTASPGDYSSEYLTPQISVAPSHVLVVAGQRDSLGLPERSDVSTSDAWTARIRADGRIVGWTAVPSAPLLGNAGAMKVLDGDLYVPGLESSASYADHVGIGWVPIAGDSVGPAWKVAFAETAPPFAAFQLFLPVGMLSFGGYSSGIDGTPVGFYKDVWLSKFDSAQKKFSPRADAGVKLVKGRRDGKALAYKNFIYVMGGDTEGATPDRDELDSAAVELSVLGENGAFSPFVETTPLEDPGNGPYKQEAFTACVAAGSMYVIGGSPFRPLDVVLMSRIDESNGKLGAWQAVTKLPAGRAGAGCFEAHGRLYVLGGKGATAREATVFWSQIGPDGTLGPWDSQSEPLPAARSQIAATAY